MPGPPRPGSPQTGSQSVCYGPKLGTEKREGRGRETEGNVQQQLPNAGHGLAERRAQAHARESDADPRHSVSAGKRRSQERERPDREGRRVSRRGWGPDGTDLCKGSGAVERRGCPGVVTGSLRTTESRVSTAATALRSLPL